MRRRKLANAAIALAVLALTGCGSDEPKKFNAAGSVTVGGLYDLPARARNEPCKLSTRNTDIKIGSTIEITDGAGKTIAFAEFDSAD